MIEYRKHITRAMLRAEPEKLFVFGDNWAGYGMGGQAKAMRGEPNAVGIPTKKFPHMREDAFFTDDDFAAWCRDAGEYFLKLANHVLDGKIVVWPVDGIGTGRAQLKVRASKIWEFIEVRRQSLERFEKLND